VAPAVLAAACAGASLLAAGPAPALGAPRSDTSRWPSYLDHAFGFGLRYPPGYRVKYYGPNLAMRDLMAGKQISGTVPPSRQTIGFSRSRAPGFHVVVYGPPAQFSPAMTPAGQCGSQFARLLINRIVTIDRLRVLERRQVRPDGRVGIDYCFGSGGGYLIVLRAQHLRAGDVARVDRLLRLILATVRLFPAAR